MCTYILRDLKPSNILFKAPRGTASLDWSSVDVSTIPLKVGDFGSSRFLPRKDGDKMTKMVGTKRYMAPEVAEGTDYGPSADIYSIAVIAFELASGIRVASPHLLPGIFSNHLFFSNLATVLAASEVPDLATFFMMCGHQQHCTHCSTPSMFPVADLPQMQGKSASLKSFLSVSLDLDKARRPPAAQLLRHEFLGRHLPTIHRMQAGKTEKRKKTVTAVSYQVVGRMARVLVVVADVNFVTFLETSNSHQTVCKCAQPIGLQLSCPGKIINEITESLLVCSPFRIGGK